MIATLIRNAHAALLLLLCLTVLPATAAEEAILLIDQIAGVAGVQRDGKRLALNPGDALEEQDLIVTDRSGRMTLRLGRHGFVEVGPSSEVGVERLPFAAFARDLKSIFSVSKGYFRVVWKHPQLSTHWPLFVYMAGHRISLVSGEYFFQNFGTEQRACVAAGQIALQVTGGEGVETIKPPACARLVAGQAPVVTARNPDDWIGVRRGYSIEATASAVAARDPAAAPLPPPVAVAKPIINAVPMAQPAMPSAPTAIPAPPEMIAAVPSSPLDEQPGLDTSGRGGMFSAPIIAAPVLPQPTAAPRTAMAAALPVVELPPLVNTPAPAKPLDKPLVSAPLVIGEVKPAVTPPPPAPAPAPRPAATPTAPASVTAAAASGGAWALNIASYSEAAVAEREVARLKANGYNVVTRPTVISGKTWHRVQLAGFANAEAAKGAAVELKTRLGLQNIWVVKP